MNPIQTKSRSAGRVRLPARRRLELPRQIVRLTNGTYRVQLSAVGSGVSEWGDVAVSRWTPDATCEPDGFHVYLRDLEDDSIWSVGYQPTRVMPQQYEFSCADGVAEIVRSDGELECRLAVAVAPDQDFELRWCRITNRGSRSRQIELTSYVEFVLCGRDADANHPTFAKLFVETQFLSERNAVLARRRPRGANEREIWGWHALVRDDADDWRGTAEFETNRTRFLGRGRSLAHPRALDPEVRLTGDQGPVLDPIGSLRTTLLFQAGETRDVVFLLGAGRDLAQIEAAIASTRTLSRALAVFDAVRVESANGLTNGSGNGSHDGETNDRTIIHPPHRFGGENGADGEAHQEYLPASVTAPITAPTIAAERESLQFENSYGGFSSDGREYVLRLDPDGRGGHRLPPQPWVNVIANEQGGFIVSERGAGYAWMGNSRLNRLTAWYNDPVSDPHAEAFWIRDEDAGTYWSPLAGPSPSAGAYEVRHGFGYTTFRHEGQGLAQEVTMFMAQDEPVKLVRVRLVNRAKARRRLSLFSFTRWGLGGLVAETADSITTEYDDSSRAIFARCPRREINTDCVAFSAVAVAESGDAAARISFTADRRVFLGEHGDLDAPAAVTMRERLDGRTGAGLDPCAAWQVPAEIGPDETWECTFLLGEVVDADTAAKLIAKYHQPSASSQALEEAQEFWRELLSAVEVETPAKEFDFLVNGWLPYQDLSCRIWARSAFYQPGGAFGFRDQLQDSSALVYHRPELTRVQILRHASQQFEEGDVLHWWHAESGCGLRTRFSDDLLWLPFVTASYLDATGDEGLLDEVTPFIKAPLLEPGEQESYLRPELAGTSATVYEHCCRAFDRGLTTGAHGLPLIGCGDWNDGMNRVGVGGTGESVWLGFFICAILEAFLPICERRGDTERIARYTTYRERLVEALNTSGWDGRWYRRAYYDNGQPIGSAQSDECQIDALVQAWAVLSQVAPPERATMAMKAVEERLVDERAGLIRLLTPAFNRTPHDPGYIKGYVPGVRENGGQYTHGVLWYVRAMAELGRGTQAVELLQMIGPIAHTRTPELVAVYQTEPYVVAADVYGEAPHVGRGGWTWYTGSAGWMLRIAIESILGLSIEGGQTLVLRPAIARGWPQCRLTYRLPDGKTRYEITIGNPDGNETGVVGATLDGKTAAVVGGAARISIARDGKCHAVALRL